jgi:GntR family transcriptional regulator, trigonelline degradation regulator
MTSETFRLLNVERFAAPLRQRVEAVLRDAIVAGRLAQGRRLTERELVQMTGTSRTLVREALRRLEAERLITVTPNKGAVVRELTLDEAREIYAVRAVLEGLAAREFVRAAGDASMQRLREAAESAIRAYEADALTRAFEWHNRFYDVLFEGAANETLRSILGSLHTRILRWRALGLTHRGRSPARSKEAARGLKAILTAIRARDAEKAERAARDQVERGAAELMRVLGAAGAQAAPRARRRA